MFVTAVSSPARPHWRWRITSYAGEVISESEEEFATITGALDAGRSRATQIDEPDEPEKRRTWNRWRFGRLTVLLVVGLAMSAASVMTPGARI